MSDQIELRLTPHEYAWAHILHQWLMPLKHPRSWMFLGAAIVIGLWLQGSIENPPSPRTYALAALIIIPAWLTKEYLFVYRYFRGTSLPVCRIALLDEGLHYQYTGFDHVYKWSEIRSLNSAGPLVFLRLGGRRFLLLVRRGFQSPEHFADWQQRIRHRLESTTKV